MCKITHFLIIILLLFSCSGTKDKPATNPPGPGKDSKYSVAETEKVPAAIVERGKEVYRKHCMACHQENGEGIAGMYPPLTDSETVNGQASEVIGIVLHGLAGEIEVKGEIYNHVMIPHNFLSDKEIAALLTYLRSSFGNSAGRIREEEVADVREKGS